MEKPGNQDFCGRNTLNPFFLGDCFNANKILEKPPFLCRPFLWRNGFQTVEIKMTILKRIIFLTPLIITLAACSSSASFIPYEDELPDAVVGTSYFQKVDIFGGRVIAGRKPILGTIEPDDNGIFMENCRLPDYAITPDTTLFVDAN